MNEDLKIRIGANTTGLNQALTRANQRIDSFATSVSRHAKRAALAFAGIVTAAGVIGAKFDKEKSDKKFYKKRNEERRVKVQCECGRIVNFGSLGGHRKTKIHQELLNK